MKLRCFWFITLFALCHSQLHAQAVTTQLPPAGQREAIAFGNSAQAQAQTSSEPQAQVQPSAQVQAPMEPQESAHSQAQTQPQAPAPDENLPQATVIPAPPKGKQVRMRWDHLTVLSLPHGNEYRMRGHVVLYYGSYIVQADQASYNDGTGQITAQGHLRVDGGPDEAHLMADHGSLNLYRNTATLYDVSGWLGVHRLSHGQAVYSSLNPYQITGKELIELSAGHYIVHDGSMTACRLPHPDWRFYAGRISIKDGKAAAANARFRLFGVPLLYVPYVKHEIEHSRNSGFLLPIAGNNSKYGAIVGESVYFTLGRSADIVAGLTDYSNRGLAPFARFRYRGRGDNYAQVRFHSLLDHHSGSNNLGGIDLLADGRYDFTRYTRVIVDAEYLSSYTYRLTFEQNYSLATNSEVQSQLYFEHLRDGFSDAIRFERYQNFQNVTPAGNEVRILHLPQVDLDAVDHHIVGLPVYYDYHASVAALSRYDYNPYGTAFRTGSEVPRLDLWPAFNAPLHYAGWNFRPEFALRDTWYGKSQKATPLDRFPVLDQNSINRVALSTGFLLRPPVVGRDFDAPWVEHLFGGALRHTLSPEIDYHYVTGIDNFRRILRFDDNEVASDTNEVEYSLTQRLYRRARKPVACTSQELELHPTKSCGGDTNEWLSWRVAQKYYFEPDFGGAVTPGTANPLLATLDFTGVDFLDRPRHTSPVVSQLKFSTSGTTSAEWDLNYDVKSGRIDASNVYANWDQGNYHLRVGDAYLDTVIGQAPTVEASEPAASSILAAQAAKEALQPTPYHQLSLTAVYGAANRVGLNLGSTANYDLKNGNLQYGAVQASYNWNCCGFSVEVRHFSLANDLRNDTEELFSFTLTGFGSTGIPHSARIF